MPRGWTIVKRPLKVKTYPGGKGKKPKTIAYALNFAQPSLSTLNLPAQSSVNARETVDNRDEDSSTSPQATAVHNEKSYHHRKQAAQDAWDRLRDKTFD